MMRRRWGMKRRSIMKRRFVSAKSKCPEAVFQEEEELEVVSSPCRGSSLLTWLPGSRRRRRRKEEKKKEKSVFVRPNSIL